MVWMQRDLTSSSPSAIVFGIGFVILFFLASYPVLTLICWSVIFGTLAGGAYVGYHLAMSKINSTKFDHPFASVLRDDTGIPPDCAHKILDSVLRYSNEPISKLKKLLLCEDISTALYGLALFWFVSLFSDWFSGITLLYLMFIGAFTLPKVGLGGLGDRKLLLAVGNSRIGFVNRRFCLTILKTADFRLKPASFFNLITNFRLISFLTSPFPQVYEVYQEPIDEYINMAMKKKSEVEDMIIEKVPALKTIIKPKAD